MQQWYWLQVLRKIGAPEAGLIYHGEPLVKHAVKAALETTRHVWV